PWQTLRAAGAGHDAERDLGQPEDGGAPGEPEVGGERQLAPAAKGVAAHRRDRHLRRGGQGVEGPCSTRSHAPNCPGSSPSISLTPAPAAKCLGPPVITTARY